MRLPRGLGGAAPWSPLRTGVLVLGGVALLLPAWALYLAVALPPEHVAPNWDVVWVGLDLALAALAAAAVLAFRRRSRWTPVLGGALAGVPVRVGSRRELNPDKTSGQIRVQRMAYRFATRVVANSPAAAAILRTEGVQSSRVSMIPNGVDAGAYPDRAVRWRGRHPGPTRQTPDTHPPALEQYPAPHNPNRRD